MKGFNEFIGESKIKPILIDRLEIWPKDLGKMTWDEAKVEVAKLGPGWRLPTIEECFIMYNHKVIIANNYWSSSEYDYFLAWSFNFYYGIANYYYKYTTTYVRAVRDFDAIEYLFADF